MIKPYFDKLGLLYEKLVSISYQLSGNCLDFIYTVQCSVLTTIAGTYFIEFNNMLESISRKSDFNHPHAPVSESTENGIKCK